MAEKSSEFNSSKYSQKFGPSIMSGMGTASLPFYNVINLAYLAKGLNLGTEHLVTGIRTLTLEEHYNLAFEIVESYKKKSATEQIVALFTALQDNNQAERTAADLVMPVDGGKVQALLCRLHDESEMGQFNRLIQEIKFLGFPIGLAPHVYGLQKRFSKAKVVSPELEKAARIYSYIYDTQVSKEMMGQKPSDFLSAQTIPTMRLTITLKKMYTLIEQNDTNEQHYKILNETTPAIKDTLQKIVVRRQIEAEEKRVGGNRSGRKGRKRESVTSIDDDREEVKNAEGVRDKLEMALNMMGGRFYQRESETGKRGLVEVDYEKAEQEYRMKEVFRKLAPHLSESEEISLTDVIDYIDGKTPRELTDDEFFVVHNLTYKPEPKLDVWKRSERMTDKARGEALSFTKGVRFSGKSIEDGKSEGQYVTKVVNNAILTAKAASIVKKAMRMGIPLETIGRNAIADLITIATCEDQSRIQPYFGPGVISRERGLSPFHIAMLRLDYIKENISSIFSVNMEEDPFSPTMSSELSFDFGKKFERSLSLSEASERKSSGSSITSFDSDFDYWRPRSKPKSGVKKRQSGFKVPSLPAPRPSVQAILDRGTPGVRDVKPKEKVRKNSLVMQCF